MFPIAFPAGSIEGRSLRADDIAGVTDLYPAPGVDDRLGSISGTVTRNGQGVFGAHVVTYHLRTGRIVAGFTVTDAGAFAVGGLDPGPCLVRVEPLDDGDSESFFDGSRVVETGFGVTYAERLAVVPRGGDAGGLEIAVRRDEGVTRQWRPPGRGVAAVAGRRGGPGGGRDRGRGSRSSVSGGWWGGLALGVLEPTLTGPQVPTGSPVPYFSAEAAHRARPRRRGARGMAGLATAPGGGDRWRGREPGRRHP